MNILLLVKHFDFGGAENHVCELANELVREGENVLIVTGKGRQRQKLVREVKQHFVLFYEWNTVLLVFKIFNIVKREKIDVIHAHQRFPILIATLAGILCKIPTVATVHGDSRHDLKSRFVKKRLTSIIFINKKVFNSYQNSSLIGNKINFIPNGFPLPAENIGGLSSNANETTDNYGDKNDIKTVVATESRIQRNPKRIFYVSRLDKRHGKLLEMIIKEVMPVLKKSYPEAELHIVGEGKGLKITSELLSSPFLNSLKNSVSLENYSENIYSLYHKADLVMGVGRVAGESLINGVPLLSIKSNHLGEIITRENFSKLLFTNYVAVDSKPPEPKRVIEILTDFFVTVR